MTGLDAGRRRRPATWTVEPSRRRAPRSDALRRAAALARAAASGYGPAVTDRLKLTAVVLRAVDYGESDRVVTLLTRERGKVSAFARGARASRRRFGGALEPFTLVAAEARERAGSDLLGLDSVSVLRAHGAIRGDLARIACAGYAVELARELVRDHEPHEELLALLVDYLGALDAGPARPAALRAFELGALRAAGLMPRLDACASCGGPLAGGGARPVRSRAGRGALRACAPAAAPGAPWVSASAAGVLARLQAEGLAGAEAAPLAPCDRPRGARRAQRVHRAPPRPAPRGAPIPRRGRAAARRLRRWRAISTSSASARRSSISCRSGAAALEDCDRFEVCAGGAPANVATGLARLGRARRVPRRRRRRSVRPAPRAQARGGGRRVRLPAHARAADGDVVRRARRARRADLLLAERALLGGQAPRARRRRPRAPRARDAGCTSARPRTCCRTAQAALREAVAAARALGRARLVRPERARCTSGTTSARCGASARTSCPRAPLVKLSEDEAEV